MATKAQQAKAEQVRSNRKPKPKQVKRSREDSAVERTLAAGNTTDRRKPGANTARRNIAHRSDNTGGPALEDSANGKPSRKSTRKSAGHVKLASNLTRRQKRKVASPKERAARAAVR